MSDEEMLVTIEANELLRFVYHCLEYKNADVFALGLQGDICRLGEIAGYIFMAYYANGTPKADTITIVLPPSGGRDLGGMRDDVRAGVHRAYRRFEDTDRTIPFAEKAYASLRFIQMSDFAGDPLALQLAEGQNREVIIVGEAAFYRFSDVVPSETATAEDVWCAHLHRAMIIAEHAAREKGSYIILDAGVYLPVRGANTEFLKTAGDVGLVGGSINTPMTFEEVREQAAALYDAVAQGEIGKALAAIDGETRMSDRQKWMLRLILLGRSGMHDRVSEILDASAEIIAALDPDIALGVARVAAESGRDDKAQILLERALPTVLSANDLENALRIAQDTGRLPLVQKVRDKLCNLHPGSEVLQVYDAESAVRDGDYGRAVELLAKNRNRNGRRHGQMFKMLADAVGGDHLSDPIALSRELCASMPDVGERIQHELVLLLERAGRRDEAVRFLLLADIAWNERWFATACGLIERALAAGSGAITDDVLAQLIEMAIRHLALNPGDGVVRTRTSDLLDPARGGDRHLSLLAVAALRRSQIRLVNETMTDVESAHLDDIGELPGIVERVFGWLDRRGDGIIIAGRHVVPREILREDPDAVLDALLHFADHHTPDPTDETDARVMQYFVVAAIAVAPSAANRDADLSVLRLAAIKLALGGRAQLARDLAEQALALAGDRPERRRKALGTFADIYARVGRTRESLLMLTAALEIPVTQHPHEAWLDQVLLLRLTRDLGLADISLQIASRLREMLAQAPALKYYGHRLEILELQAQESKRHAGTRTPCR